MATNVDKCLEQISKGVLLSESVVKEIAERAREIVEAEPNVQDVPTPVTIVGDLHGQFYDLLELFQVGGKCPDTNYLFLGDYTNVGYHGVETITLLLCLKIRYPSRITLLRGNHDTRNLTQLYGFYAECLRKYGNALVWQSICQVFDCMSLAACISNKIFCVHGGLAQGAAKIDQIRVLDRFQEVPTDGTLCDLLWADPDDKDGFNASPRGIGQTFGPDIINKFTHHNDIEHITRTHQICMDGFQTNKMVTTVWSAPNYCNRQNVAAILEVSEEHHTRLFNIFMATPEGFRVRPAPDPGFEVPRAIPEYFQ